jgi:hypothetical protein
MSSAAESRRLAGNPFRDPSPRELRRERREHEATWRGMTLAARDARTADLERELAELDGTAKPAPAPALPAAPPHRAPARDEQDEYDAILNVPPGYFWDKEGYLQRDPPEREALAVATRRCPVCGHAPGSPCHTMTGTPQPKKRPHPKRAALVPWPAFVKQGMSGKKAA